MLRICGWNEGSYVTLCMMEMCSIVNIVSVVILTIAVGSRMFLGKQVFAFAQI